MSSKIEGTLTMEGLRSLTVGVLLALLGVLCYLVPVMSERGPELQSTAATVAQFFAGAAAGAFGLGKMAEAHKHRPPAC